jgi:hypothetical protein
MLGVLALAWIAFSLLGPEDMRHEWGCQVVIAVVCVFSVFLVPKINAREFQKRHERDLGPFHGSADDLQFQMRGERGTSMSMQWSAFKGIRRAGDGLIVLISRDYRPFLDRRMFATEEDWRKFVELVRRHVSRAARRS